MKNLRFLLIVPVLMTLCLPFNVYSVEQDELSVAINRAGMQRMLSQRIAKAYLFVGMGIRTDKARKQLKEGLELFQKNHEYLKNTILDSGVQEMLAFVGGMLDQYVGVVSKPYTNENGGEVLDLSETILEASHDIVKKLEAMSEFKKDKIINISGRQRMLSQRIAKYYIAYQAGFHDDYTIIQLKTAVKEFEDAHHLLARSEQNTPEINDLLYTVNSLWKLVRKFFLDVEKGGLPVSVLATTDNILKNMNAVTKAYVKTQAG